MVQQNKKRRLILLFLLLFLTGCNISPGGEAVIESGTESLADTEEADSTAQGQETMNLGSIWVHVCGEVKHPGVYELETGSRVIDAVNAAGGFTKKADEESLNLAEEVTDASKIRVLSEEESKEEEQSRDSSNASQSTDGRIDLNTATLEELMSLPGIGEKRAQAILALRQSKGSFQKTEDLMEVEGIKEGIFQKIKDLIKV
jgi:competence protein ComEA